MPSSDPIPLLTYIQDFLCWLMMAATAFASMAAADAASGISKWYALPFLLSAPPSSLLHTYPISHSLPLPFYRLVGMSLMYVLQLAAIFQWATRQSSDVENQIVSVERIQQVRAYPLPLFHPSLLFSPLFSFAACVLFQPLLVLVSSNIIAHVSLPPSGGPSLPSYSTACCPLRLTSCPSPAERLQPTGLTRAASSSTICRWPIDR